MSDDFFAPPPFDPTSALSTLKRTLRDLKLAEGIEVLSEQGATICAVIAPRAVVEAVAAEPGAAEPELIRKAKEDEEEAKEKK